MKTDTTPATPTPEGLRAALALIDTLYAYDDPEMTAVLAMARAAVAERKAARALDIDDIDQSWAVDVWHEATDVRDAAVAALCALATVTP